MKGVLFMSEELNTEKTEQKVVYVEKGEGNGLAVAALVLGIIGVALTFIPFLPYITGVLAIIFGVVGMNKEVKKGMATAGLVLGIITIGLKVLFWMGLFSFFG